jgi:hypothetical protein
MYPGLYKCNSRESRFVEFCVDGINLYVGNNFIDSLGLGRDSNPDPSALKPNFIQMIKLAISITVYSKNKWRKST